jgi:hypothetical protein
MAPNQNPSPTTFDFPMKLETKLVSKFLALVKEKACATLSSQKFPLVPEITMHTCFQTLAGAPFASEDA